MRSKVAEVDRRFCPNDKKERWVINLSEKELTTAERNVLEKGMNFSPTPRWVPTVDVIASVEGALKRCNNGMGAEMVRGRVASLIRKFEGWKESQNLA